MSNIDDIYKFMESPSREDKALIQKAYDFAKKAHEGQKRYSGEPYFTHVFETATILAELGMGARTIAAGLLHDTLEDVESVTDKDLKNEFGSDILFLVEGVTKLGHVRFKGASRHTESLRKLFVATSEDVRVLIIKLADRLHNMRTLKHVPEHKQKRIAQETMEVYAPIAHRLGIGKMRGELEDLAFPFLYPEEYKMTEEMSRSRYKESERRLEKVYKRLRKELATQKIEVLKSDHRKKHLYSLWRKLVRKDMDIDRIYDILALRIVVPTVQDCYRVLGVVHQIYRPLPGRIKDYIAFPKPNGYQSIHTTILTGDGGIAEVQIRTMRMHREAEYGIASHVGYKNGGDSGIEWLKQLIPILRPRTTNTDTAKTPEWLKELAEAQEESIPPKEFMARLREDFFENRIFVFTPKGDVIDLPVDSSPIDFAYQVHTDIGDHIASAKINSKMASLSTHLHNGDIVEIQTRKTSWPTRKWLDYTKTNFARRHIRSALQRGKKN